MTEYKATRILGKPSHKFIHPLYEFARYHPEKKYYPIVPEFNRNSRTISIVKTEEKIRKQKLVLDFINKPYMPFSTELLIDCIDVDEHLVNLEDYYSKNKKNIYIVKHMTNMWFRLYIKKLRDEMQFSIAIDYLHKFMLEQCKLEIDKKKLGKIITKFMEIKQDSFEFDIIQYILSNNS